MVLSQLLWGGTDTRETGYRAHDKENEQHRQGTGVMGIPASPRLQGGTTRVPGVAACGPPCAQPHPALPDTAGAQ